MIVSRVFGSQKSKLTLLEVQGVPKKIRFKPIFEFLTLGRVFVETFQGF